MSDATVPAVARSRPGSDHACYPTDRPLISKADLWKRLEWLVSTRGNGTSLGEVGRALDAADIGLFSDGDARVSGC
jgi:hypothetical protein